MDLSTLQKLTNLDSSDKFSLIQKISNFFTQNLINTVIIS
jgi:hypothetical protein